MGVIEILLIGLALAVDSFAAAICKGLSMEKMSWKKAIIIAVYFGVFQIIMPVAGYLIGSIFEGAVTNINHWIAFFLFVLIGGNLVKESFDDELDKRNDKVDFKNMLILAIITSIDALTIGIVFSLFKVDMIFAVSTIAITTFVLSILGVKIGNKFGDSLQNKSELVGGTILILIGLKLLVEHLGML